MEGMLFCKMHLGQIAELENLDCPRGCGKMEFKSGYIRGKMDGFYGCRECEGRLLDAKRMDRIMKYSDHAGPPPTDDPPPVPDQPTETEEPGTVPPPDDIAAPSPFTSRNPHF